MKKDYSNVVSKFKRGLLSRRELIQEFTSLILTTPQYFGYFDRDIKNEFFAICISKIEKIINSYQEREDAVFLTWFNVVLKNEFRMFIKKWNAIENFESKQIYNLKNLNILYEDACYFDKEDCQAFDPSMVKLPFLKSAEKEIIKYKYGIFQNGVKISEVQDQIEKKLEIKKRYEELINHKFVELIRIQQKILTELCVEKKNVLKKKEQKIKQTKRSYEKIRDNIYYFPTNKDVGNKLNLSGGTVGTYLNRFKNKLEKIGYENLYHSHQIECSDTF